MKSPAEKPKDMIVNTIILSMHEAHIHYTGSSFAKAKSILPSISRSLVNN